jgi:hypothetical protein
MILLKAGFQNEKPIILSATNRSLFKSFFPFHNDGMKTIISSMLLLFPLLAQSNCKVYIPVKEYLHAGLTIQFDFTKILKEKNYTEVFSPNEDHSWEIHVKGEEPTRNHFNYAEGSLILTHIDGTEKVFKGSVICFTQYCAISDFGKSFNKAYKQMNKAASSCRVSVRH